MNSQSKFILDNLLEASAVLKRLIDNKNNIDLISKSVELFTDTFKNNKRIFSCGNGGSMCDAIHFAEELTGRFRKNRPALPAVAISDPGYLSCVFNDYGQEFVFSRYLEAWGNHGDVLLAISTSGQSKNVIKACEVAKQKGMKIVGLLGRDGGQIKSLVDYPIVVESQETDRIQEVHIKIIHQFIEGIERNLFPENY